MIVVNAFRGRLNQFLEILPIWMSLSTFYYNIKLDIRYIIQKLKI
jgi:hypothetical protein